jgi:hypothetical protein
LNGEENKCDGHNLISSAPSFSASVRDNLLLAADKTIKASVIFMNDFQTGAVL